MALVAPEFPRRSDFCNGQTLPVIELHHCLLLTFDIACRKAVLAEPLLVHQSAAGPAGFGNLLEFGRHRSHVVSRRRNVREKPARNMARINLISRSKR